MDHFTKQEMRRFLVHYHGLDQLNQFGEGIAGIKQFFEHIGSIQNDPLNVVGKNAELVLHARFDTNVAQALNDLLYAEKHLVDGFDKESSIHGMKDWKRFSHVRQALTKSDYRVLEHRGYLDALDHLDDVMHQFEGKQRFTSKDFNLGSGDKHSWWSTSHANCVLNYLWCQGKIGIDSRNKTIRVFSHIENIVPQAVLHETELDFDHFFEWYVLRRLKQMGVYWLKRGPGWLGFYLKDMKQVKAVIHRATQSGKLQEISIEGFKESFYLHTEDYKRLLEIKNEAIAKPQVRFIAPLDNMIWDRSLIKQLFDFEYTWEVYVPQAKRKFGYYVLPMLYGDQFIGRIEPRRKQAEFTVENIWFEDQRYQTKGIQRLIDEEIQRHRRNFGGKHD